MQVVVHIKLTERGNEVAHNSKGSTVSFFIPFFFSFFLTFLNTNYLIQLGQESGQLLNK